MATCTATAKSTGERCKRSAILGGTVCLKHGGNLPRVRAKAQKTVALRDMESRNIRPIDADDREGRGDVALAVELRRTIAWIRFCEAQIEHLAGVGPLRADPDAGDALADVLGGLQTVARESTTGVERGEDTALTTEKQAVAVNVWEEKLRWNRTHLTALTRQWISAGFEQKRLELMSKTIDMIVQVIDGIVRDLGHNPNDADVRAVIKRRLAALLGSA